MARSKPYSSVPLSLIVAVSLFMPTNVEALSVSMNAETLSGPATPGEASPQPSFGWWLGPVVPMWTMATECLRDATDTGGLGSSRVDGRHLAVSAGLSPIPLPDTCPDYDDGGFWDDVWEQIFEACEIDEDEDTHYSIRIIEIECDEISDGFYRFRARVDCNYRWWS